MLIQVTSERKKIYFTKPTLTNLLSGEGKISGYIGKIWQSSACHQPQRFKANAAAGATCCGTSPSRYALLSILKT